MRYPTNITNIGVETGIFQVVKSAPGYPCFRAMPALPVSTEPVGAWAVLQDLANLKRDWDGYGALPVSVDSCAHAQKFLADSPLGMSAPEITPTSNGTITFEWESEAGDALLEIGRTRFSGHIQPTRGQTIFLQGGLVTSSEQAATEQVLAVIKELLYAGFGSESIAHSIQISKPSF